ncbi:Calcium-binding mitochondrial carrier protein SCaMC-1 [Taenia crassiceps]|uniref:Calcium-binding mitochondrial carrier protein SCaMC-1 n=1 Tax=Taenia crassiceps TaxID=6207 RepID=A0ABR4QKT7_9CEST
MPEKSNLKPEDRERIAKLFKELDVDKDGRVSVAELASKIKGSEQAATAVKIISRGDDPHSKSTMTFNEFLDYVMDTETQLKLAFRQMDKNHDNVVDASEIRAAMLELGVEIGQKEAEMLLRKVDKDGSLSIDYNEWRDFLLLSGKTRLDDIFHYWRRASAVDIGELVQVPDDYTEEEKKSGEAWRTLLAGGLAGCVSRTATAPLDRIKTIYQARGGRAASTGLVGSFRRMLKEGGYISMWRGNGVNCIKIAPEQAFRFQAYETYKRLFFKKDGSTEPLSMPEKFTAGALAGATSQTLIYPMEVLKTRMCLRKTGQYSSIFDCARKLYGEHGMWIFYRGYVPNLALNRSTEKSGTQKLTGPPVYVSLTAGACSSVCGQVATYPLALIKTKLQAESEKISLERLVQRIIKTEGIMGLYRGMGANMLKVIPAVSISYACYEKARAMLGI